MTSRLILISLITALIFVFGVGILYLFGRSLWHPLLTKINGEYSVQDRINFIVAKKSYLINLPTGKITLIVFKEEKELSVLIDGKKWKSYNVLAASGKSGPKLQVGDRQVPEGFYIVDAINPNSSYYLSLRVSYPNDEDKIRSSKIGISDLGGDIYIHGKAVSIGCLAMGDDAIEDIFYLVATRKNQETEVIIAPSKGMKQFEIFGIKNELYVRLEAKILSLK